MLMSDETLVRLNEVYAIVSLLKEQTIKKKKIFC